MQINRLGVFPEVTSVPDDYRGLVLKADAEGLSLYSPLAPAVSPTRVDFQADAMRHRVATSSRSAGLLKAAGLDKARAPLHVLDATAGLGIDAYLLAAFGCQVTLLEKSPVMAVLLADGLRRGRDSDDGEVRASLARMTLQVADARDWLHLQPGEDRPDVVCLDPMFPARQKSAKVKKDMALMQTLLPPNTDVGELLDGARKLALKRVVLKCPGKVARQPDPKPDFQVPGKACHFRVYLRA